MAETENDRFAEVYADPKDDTAILKVKFLPDNSHELFYGWTSVQ